MNREQLIEETRSHFAGFINGLVKLKIIGRKAADFIFGITGIDSPLQTRCPHQELYPKRTPPNDENAERIVLSGILLDNEALNIIQEILHVEDFFYPLHRAIFKTMIDIAEEGIPVDVVTLRAHLKHLRAFQNFNWDDYLLSLTNTIPSTSAIEANAKVIFEKAVIRKLIGACRDVINRGYGDNGLIEDLLDEADQVSGKASKP